MIEPMKFEIDEKQITFLQTKIRMLPSFMQICFPKRRIKFCMSAESSIASRFILFL